MKDSTKSQGTPGVQKPCKTALPLLHFLSNGSVHICLMPYCQRTILLINYSAAQLKQQYTPDGSTNEIKLVEALHTIHVTLAANQGLLTIPTTRQQHEQQNTWVPCEVFRGFY